MFCCRCGASEFFQGLRRAEDHPAGCKPSDPCPGRRAGHQTIPEDQQKRVSYPGRPDVPSDAQLILKTALSAKERLGRHEHFIPFDIGCHNYIELGLLPSVLKELSEEFPLLRPSMHLVPFPGMQGMVINQQLHVAFGIKGDQPKSALSYRRLCTAPVACICSPASPLARYTSLSREDLSGNIIACSPRHISGSVFAVQNNILIGLPPEQRYFTENVESAFTLAKAQVGYTIYPDIPKVRDPELCYIPLKDVPELSFGVYYRRDDDHPVLKQFLRLMNRFFPKTHNGRLCRLYDSFNFLISIQQICQHITVPVDAILSFNIRLISLFLTEHDRTGKYKYRGGQQ